MALDLAMFRKGLDPKKTYYQIKKEEEEKADNTPVIASGIDISKVNVPATPAAFTTTLPIDPLTGKPKKRGRGRPRKYPKID